jgi:hypothetical protein
MASHDTCISLGIARDFANTTLLDLLTGVQLPPKTPLAQAPTTSPQLLPSNPRRCCSTIMVQHVEDESIVPSCHQSKPAISHYRSTRHSRLQQGSSLFAHNHFSTCHNTNHMTRVISVSSTLCPFAAKALSLLTLTKRLTTDHKLTAKHHSRIPPQVELRSPDVSRIGAIAEDFAAAACSPWTLGVSFLVGWQLCVCTDIKSD